MALILRLPAEIALKTATLSAQIDNPKETFSIFVPVKMSPSSVISAAPTGNLL